MHKSRILFGIVALLLVGIIAAGGVFVLGSKHLGSAHTISLVGGNITFTVPNGFVLDPEPQNGKNQGFDFIRFISPGQQPSTFSQTQGVGGSGSRTSLLSIAITTGTITYKGNPPSEKKAAGYTMKSFTDTSVIPTSNPRISANNTVVFTRQFLYNDPNNSQLKGSPNTSIQAHTNVALHFTDNNVRQTNIDIMCSDYYLVNGPSCRDVVREILSSLSVQEPLPTGIRDITRPSAQ